jgi:hypothetical protein
LSLRLAKRVGITHLALALDQRVSDVARSTGVLGGSVGLAKGVHWSGRRRRGRIRASSGALASA